MNTAHVTFTETDLTFSIAALAKGISGWEGETLRGPVTDPKDIVRNWNQFKKLFGGFQSTNDFPLLAYRALNKGAFLRINRMGHYSDITDASTLEVTKAELPSAVLLTFAGALITANKYDLTINGTPIAQVTFTTDNDTTLGLIATSIAALSAFVASATVILIPASTSNDRQILIIPVAGVTLALTGSTVSAGASQTTTTQPNVQAIYDAAGIPLFSLAPKYEGADYNNLVVEIAAASNGDNDYFNMTISHLIDGYTETYTNLKIIGNPVIADSTFLNDVANNSSWVDVSYLDLSSTSGQQRPLNGTYQFINGDNGGSVVVGDYEGDASANTGLYAFNDFDDMMQICAPHRSDQALHSAGEVYAELRKDLVYFAHLDNANPDANSYISDRAATSIDSTYVAFFGGGLIINDPQTGVIREISELGDICALAANSDANFGEWFAFAGPTRGEVTDALGVVNNYGGNAQFNDLNAMANRQINMVVVRNSKIMLWGNYTAQIATSQLSQLSVRRLGIFIKKSLTPTLEAFLQEPNTPSSWKALFRRVEPFFGDLINRQGIFSFRWEGDQDVSVVSDTVLVVNNEADVNLGKYKVNLFIKAISAINEIEFNLVFTPAGVQFNEA